MTKVAFNNNRMSARTVRVFSAVEKLLEAGENVRTRKLDLTEFARILERLPADRKPLFELALFTGMRPGELVPVNRYSGEGTRGLTWDRVDYQDRVIRLEAEDTKTGEGRAVPITDEILDVLRRIARDLRSGHVFTYRGKPEKGLRGSGCHLRAEC
ncbi:MAG TPA: tyrosine-type recombinase/integrase [Syntrophobacteria bacterium]|nr:tyrosine-type recombinase/integrase [Syntrophobacteria bacterium]